MDSVDLEGISSYSSWACYYLMSRSCRAKVERKFIRFPDPYRNQKNFRPKEKKRGARSISYSKRFIIRYLCSFGARAVGYIFHAPDIAAGA